MTAHPPTDAPWVSELLSDGDLEVEGMLAAASNATLRAVVRRDGAEARCVIKPVAGERPLWDFPEGTLSGREVAAFALSEHLGWDLVPPTVWREETPWGPAMCQWWIDERPDLRPVALLPSGAVPEGWTMVLEGRDAEGREVVVAHRRSADLERIAVFDVLVNNADRKAGHLLADSSGRVWCIDHGVTFAVDAKLRTVVWGWAGEIVQGDLLDDVLMLRRKLDAGLDDVDRWLDPQERSALRQRIDGLLESGRLPVPGNDRPAIPWPVF